MVSGDGRRANATAHGGTRRRRTNKEIASALGISPKTAGHHVQHVLEKLGVHTRAAATLIAMQRGLITTRS